MFSDSRAPLIYSVVTAPTAEPVALPLLRQHVRDTLGVQNDRITRNAISAREAIENRTRRQMMQATYDLFLPCFPDEIRLPRSPALSVTSISYVDADGATQTLAATVYTADIASEPARIYRAYNQVWPTIRYQEKAVTVRFVAGYSSSATLATARAAIPGGLIDALLVKTELIYLNPEEKEARLLVAAFDSLIAPYIVPLTPEAVFLTG